MAADWARLTLRAERSDAMDAWTEGMALHGSTDARSWEAEAEDGTRYSVLVSRDPMRPEADGPQADYRWHISVAAPDHLPPWGVLVELAHRLRPGVVFVLGIPPRSTWLNLHEFCLHLMQVEDENLERHWRQAAGAIGEPS